MTYIDYYAEYDKLKETCDDELEIWTKLAKACPIEDRRLVAHLLDVFVQHVFDIPTLDKILTILVDKRGFDLNSKEKSFMVDRWMTCVEWIMEWQRDWILESFIRHGLDVQNFEGYMGSSGKMWSLVELAILGHEMDYQYNHQPIKHIISVLYRHGADITVIDWKTLETQYSIRPENLKIYREHIENILR